MTDHTARIVRDLRALADELASTPSTPHAVRHLSLSRRPGEAIVLTVGEYRIEVEVRSGGLVVHAPDAVSVMRKELMGDSFLDLEHAELGEAGA